MGGIPGVGVVFTAFVDVRETTGRTPADRPESRFWVCPFSVSHSFIPWVRTSCLRSSREAGLWLFGEVLGCCWVRSGD